MQNKYLATVFEIRWRFPTANDFGSEIIPFSAKEFYVNVSNIHIKHTFKSND